MGISVPMMMLVAGGVSAVGALASAKAQSQAADFNRNVAVQNADIAKQQTDADVLALRRKQYQQLGAIKANAGASGVSMEGSPLDILESSTAAAELDVQRLKYSGTLRAQGYQNEAALYGSEAKAARTSGYLNAASGILMGGAKANYYSKPGTPVQVAG